VADRSDGRIEPKPGAPADDRRPQLRFRAFDVADLGAVQLLIHETIDRRYRGVYPPRAVQFFKEFHSRDNILERHRTGVVLVVEDDQDLVATGATVAGEITGVFVHPRFQGRGIGGQVMDRLEEIARRDGHQTAALSISLPSRGFYERRGYMVVETCSDDMGGGERLDYWEAEKHLDGRRSP
jgi:ribosomal protein S18 acetylase RimI-like enzyme